LPHIRRAGPDFGTPAPLRVAPAENSHDFVEPPAIRYGFTPPRLACVPAELRTLTAPLLRVLAKVRHEFPYRRIAVIVPELVGGRW
jgi:hypothetical protein